MEKKEILICLLKRLVKGGRKSSFLVGGGILHLKSYGNNVPLPSSVTEFEESTAPHIKIHRWVVGTVFATPSLVANHDEIEIRRSILWKTPPREEWVITKEITPRFRSTLEVWEVIEEWVEAIEGGRIKYLLIEDGMNSFDTFSIG